MVGLGQTVRGRGRAAQALPGDSACPGEREVQPGCSKQRLWGPASGRAGFVVELGSGRQ